MRGVGGSLSVVWVSLGRPRVGFRDREWLGSGRVGFREREERGGRERPVFLREMEEVGGELPVVGVGAKGARAWGRRLMCRVGISSSRWRMWVDS